MNRHEYILRDIRNGLTLPDHFASDEEEEEAGIEYVRWWENPNDPDYERFQQTYGNQQNQKGN